MSLRFLSMCVAIAACGIVAYSASGNPLNQTKYPCLDPNIDLNGVVKRGSGGDRNKTVRDRLAELRARCRKGKLMDRRNRKIRIVESECWGNPPADAEEQLRRRQEQIAKLKKTHTVIEILCNSLEISSMEVL